MDTIQRGAMLTTDIVDRLRRGIAHVDTDRASDVLARAETLMQEAANEIEHLRLLAGIVTKGESFDDIKR